MSLVLVQLKSIMHHLVDVSAARWNLHDPFSQFTLHVCPALWKYGAFGIEQVQE